MQQLAERWPSRIELQRRVRHQDLDQLAAAGSAAGRSPAPCGRRRRTASRSGAGQRAQRVLLAQVDAVGRARHARRRRAPSACTPVAPARPPRPAPALVRICRFSCSVTLPSGATPATTNEASSPAATRSLSQSRWRSASSTGTMMALASTTTSAVVSSSRADRPPGQKTRRPRSARLRVGQRRVVRHGVPLLEPAVPGNGTVAVGLRSSRPPEPPAPARASDSSGQCGQRSGDLRLQQEVRAEMGVAAEHPPRAPSPGSRR